MVVAVLKVVGIIAPPARRRLHAVPAAGRVPPARSPAATCELPLVLAPAAPHRRAAVQRQHRRRGDLVADRAVPVRGRRHGHAGRRPLGLLFVTDPVLALVGLGRLPGDRRAHRRLLAAGCRPLQTRAQQLRGEVSRDRARELRRRAGRQDAGPRGRRDRALPAPRRASCATRSSRSAGCAALFDPMMEALPSARRARRAAGRHRRRRQRRHRRRRAGQRRVPVHAAGLPGARDRLGARRAAAQRRRLGPRAAGAARRPAPGVRDRRDLPRTADRPRSSVDAGRLRVRRRPQVLHDVTFDVAAGPDRRPGRRRPAPASPPSPRCSVRLVDPDTGTVPLRRRRPARARPRRARRGGRARAAVDVRLRRHGARQRHPRPPTCRDERASGRRCALAQADGFVARAARRRSTPWSASAAPRCPAGSASASRWPAALVRPAPAAGARRRHQRASTRGSSSASWPGCASRRRGTRRGRGLPAGHHRARRRGRLPRARPGRRPRHPRASCCARSPGYLDLVTAYERAEAERRRARGRRRAR